MDPMVGSALIGAGSSLLGGLFNIGAAKKNRELQIKLNRENNQFNAEQAQLQRDFTERMYTDYQSPEALRRQYEEAGMNPYLAMSRGAGSVGSGSSASAAGTPQLQAPQLDTSSLASTMASVAQAIKLSKEASVVEQDYMENWNFMRAQADKSRGDTNWLNKGLENWKPSMADYGLQQDLYRKQAEGEIMRIDLANDVLAGQKMLMSLDAASKRTLNKYLDASQQLSLARAAQEISNLVADFHRIKASTESERARRREIIAQVAYLYAQTLDVKEGTRGKRLQNDVLAPSLNQMIITTRNEWDLRNSNAMGELRYGSRDRRLAHEILWNQSYQMDQRSRNFLLQLFSGPLSSVAGAVLKR